MKLFSRYFINFLSCLPLKKSKKKSFCDEPGREDAISA